MSTPQPTAGGRATPISYEVGGERYIVITAGGHHFMETRGGDYVIAYKLPKHPRVAGSAD